MVIGITGTSGFIGSFLRNGLANAGHEVIALARNSMSSGETTRSFDLEKPLLPGLFTGIEILIHCAFVHPARDKDAGPVNYEGTRHLIAEARSSGVKKIIFFSTVSAHKGATSVYGKTKYREESLFDLQKDVILKCGLVVGNGGLFHQLLQQALSRKLIPVIGDGRQPMQVIAIDDVLEAVKRVIATGLCGVLILANRQQFSYRGMFRAIAGVWERRLFLVPVPVVALRTAVSLARVLGISLPFNKENIAGLRALRYFDPEGSLTRLSLQPMDLEQKLLELKKEQVIKEAPR